jgi:hypothetical protein
MDDNAVKGFMRAVLASLAVTVDRYHQNTALTPYETDKILYRASGGPHWVRCRAGHNSVDSWYSTVELRLSHNLQEDDLLRARDKILHEAAERDAELRKTIKNTKDRARLLLSIRRRAARAGGSGIGKLPTEICMLVHSIVNRLIAAEEASA